MKRFLWTLLGCSAACSVFAQDISLRHNLDGKELDTLATLVLRFNDEMKGHGRVLLQDSRGLANKLVLPHLVDTQVAGDSEQPGSERAIRAQFGRSA